MTKNRIEPAPSKAEEFFGTPAPNGEAKPKRGFSAMDPEIQALAKIDRILSTLSLDAQMRTIIWLEGRYGPEVRFAAAENSVTQVG